MSNEVLWLIIKALVGLLTIFMSIAVTVGGYLHKSLMRRLDAIDTDLKPITTKIELHQQRQDAMHERLNDHDQRIKALENKHK